ncbi:E3 ubiquitin-protein ligase TRIM21-like [Sphaeramia orbicularis]|uniref:E3 ubiquitin-protein ligase TRIM21-like n=1 Tax=Sphaeramia orbicularis TaxID=375764 RepID=UPI0011801D49|nr:E3 ubiquitin-protein ligase TRIM21-like [Sphaeramia orbicularis]
MATAGRVRCEDQFLCSICLDVFTDPVTIPCGHNFCKNCITEHFNVSVQQKCPMCNEVFYTRPQLKINIFVSQMVAHFQHQAQHEPNIYSSDQQAAKPGEVPCDVCTEEKQRTTEKQAEDFIKELEQEISELRNRRIEVEKLSGSEDHLHFVQRFTSVNTALSMKTRTKVSVRPPSYEGTVVRAVSQLEDKLRQDMKNLVEAELRRVQQYEVDVTLDPDTASPYLDLSDDEKQVNCRDMPKNIQDNPKRFSICCNILGKQSFSSGRFYFEVQVKGKTKWDLGVARDSINRKAQVTLSPQNGYWTIWLRNGSDYKARTDPPVHLSLKSSPQKVGVFVDYEEGLVCFYDVDSSALIYSFIGCCFSDKLLPFFSPCRNDGGKNSAPLIITPVRHTE